MTLLNQITEDRKQAMRDKNDIKKTMLNFVLAQVKYKKIELQKDPEDTDVIQIIKKEIKALNEALIYLEKAEKKEEIAEELEKRAILEYYLPQTFSREKTESIIKETLTELGITELKTGRGLLMKELKAKYSNEIDGAVVNDIINGML